MLYLHIPFCKSRCAYCGFFSTTGLTPQTERTYIKAVCNELRMREDYLPSSEYIKTIYFGGGTPSLLSADSLHTVMQTIHETYGSRLQVKEFTVECNPDDVTPQLASTLSRLGVNRVSMGVQSFCPQILSFLHRRHHAAQVVQAIDTLRDAGIGNISIDLIYGIPGQTMDLWQSDIRQAIALSLPHISSYALSYEKGTPLQRLLDRGEITQKTDDEYLQMYLTLIDTLSDAGYEHYEISNFSLPGYRSMHNSSYWSGAPYIGIGAGAHSYKGMTASPSGFGITSRQWNVSDIQQYISDRGHPSLYVCENLNDDEQYNDIIVTQLRRREGIDLRCLPDRYLTYLLQSAQNSLDNGTLTILHSSLTPHPSTLTPHPSSFLVRCDFIAASLLSFLILLLTSCGHKDTHEETVPPAPTIDETLRQRIDSFVTAVTPIGDLGMLVYDLTADQEVYSFSPDTLMQPASCMKLFTTVAALRTFGPHAVHRTEIYTTGHLRKDTLEGNIILKVHLDPYFNADSLSRLLSYLPKQIRHLKGNVVIDMNNPAPMQHEEHWTPGDLKTRYLSLSFTGYHRLAKLLPYVYFLN